MDDVNFQLSEEKKTFETSYIFKFLGGFSSQL